MAKYSILNWFQRSNPLENPAISIGQAIDLIGSGQPAASGQYINEQTMLTSAPIFNGVRLIANTVAKLPINVFFANENRDIATTHPAQWLLKYQPSPNYTPFIFIQTLMSHAILYGNGYAIIDRNEFGTPIELIIVNPTRMHPFRENGELIYVLEGEDGRPKQKFLSSDVMHIKGLGFDGMVGYSLADILKNEIGHGLAIQQYGSFYFRNNGKPSIVVELPPNIKDAEKIQQYRDNWGKMHNGLINSNKPAFLPNSCKVTQLTGNNSDNEYLASRQHDLVIVANILGLPPSMLGSLQNLSYGSLTQDQQNYLSNSLDPWLTMFEQEATVKLLSENEKNRQLKCIEFNRKALIQVDAEVEHLLIKEKYLSGMISFKEMRRISNLPPEKNYDDGWLLPNNVTVEQDPKEVAQEQAAAAMDGEVKDDTVTEDPAVSVDPKPVQTKDPTDKARSLTKLTIERLLRHVAKSGKAVQHENIWLENLAPFENAEVVVRGLLEKLDAEMEFCLPEQREELTKNVDVDSLVGQLWS